MTPTALQGGFADTPVQASHVFRAALEAMARPGTLHDVSGAAPPAPVSPAAGALLLALCDATTPLHLAGAYDCAAVRDWVIFHCGAPLVAADEASFALGDWAALQPVGRFAIGLPDYPDRSATLFIETDPGAPANARLTGPGIETYAALSLPEIAAFQANRARFPLGFDCFFTSGNRLAALPRSTITEALECM